MRETPKLSRLEVLGAWLGLWTPPRDAVIPPVPWRAVALAAAGAVAVLGAAAAIAVPAIDRAKDERAAREEREAAAHAASRLARARREQAPRLRRATGARAQVLAAVERAILRDARARFSSSARRPTCEPAPGSDPRDDRVAYDCLAATRDIAGAGAQEGARGLLGHPFRAVVDFTDGSFAFCKVIRLPGEAAVQDPRTVAALPRPCRVPGR